VLNYVEKLGDERSRIKNAFTDGGNETNNAPIFISVYELPRILEWQ
jgi:hypothetical protein